MFSTRPWTFPPLLLFSSSLRPSLNTTRCSAALPEYEEKLMSSRERRQLRHERREAAGDGNWREKVEERLLHKTKKKPASSWMDELNIDNLARLGPQWWMIRVARTNAHYIAETLARTIANNYPNLGFKVYFPAVKEQRKLKNGSYSTKLKPLFPGCVFLHSILNKELHDFIREVDGVGGFVGSKVGNSKRQINKPKPVPMNEMEAIFRQVKEDQNKLDEALKEENMEDNKNNNSEAIGKSAAADSPKQKLKKASDQSENLVRERSDRSLRQGANIRILSGPFADFSGCIKELNLKSGKVAVSFKLFGKESIVDLEVDQVVLETT